MGFKKWIASAVLLIVVASMGALFTNAAGEPNYALECSKKVQCRAILDAMEEGVGQDTLAGLPALTPARILDHASHRLGYGLSTVDQSFLPDRMTVAQLPKVAWIIYSQVYGEDPTLEGLQSQIHNRKASFGKFASEYSVSRGNMTCFNHESLKNNGNLNLTVLPTQQLADSMAAIADSEMANDLSVRKCRFPRPAAVNVLSLATALRELLESALGTQYASESGVKDLQMSYDKVIHEFWFNHFNVDTNKPRVVAFGLQSYENTITRNQFSTFRQLLGSVIKHPGMLQYLDNDSNNVISLRDSSGRVIDQTASNQNLGRELLELHTFGLGPNTVGQSSPYNQSDVEVASLIFTGHTTQDSAYAFLPQRAARQINYVNKFFTQRSASTRPLFFTQQRLAAVDAASVETRLDYMLDQLAQHPRVLQNICRKFVTRFVLQGRNTHSAVYQTCLQNLQSTATNTNDTQLRRMYMAVAQSPQFWTFESAKKQMGNPLEIVVKNIRSLGLRYGALVEGEFGKTPMARLAVFMNDAVLDMGLPFRKYGDPTGYEMRGPEWLSQGYLINHARLSFEYAHIDKAIGVEGSEKRLALTTVNEQLLRNLNSSSTTESVSQVVYRPARGIASITKLSRDQSADVVAIGDISPTSTQLDRVDGSPSINETVYSLIKASAQEMRK